MILPFVRELLADLEHCAPFERVRRHLALSAGRKRVSGLTATARALYLPLFARAAQSPVVGQRIMFELVDARIPGKPSQATNVHAIHDTPNVEAGIEALAVGLKGGE